MAIGLALLLGFRLPQNFDRPYMATSLRQFWHRWHMTLSRWLRDYLYIPLGGNRGGRRRTYRNLMLTMLLGGLWHGAAWTFIVWGGIHGGALSVERWLRDRLGLADTGAGGLAHHLPRGLPRVGVLPRARPRARRSRCSAGLARPGPSPLVTLPVVFLAVAAVAVQAVPPAGGATSRPGSWHGRRWRRAWPSGCSWWQRTPPWDSRAWPRSSTTGSERCGSRDNKNLTMPAGRVLVVIVVALAVAALLNSEAVVRAGEGMDDGPTRDVVLALGRPLDDAAGAVGLHLPREGLDAAFGQDPKTASGTELERGSTAILRRATAGRAPRSASPPRRGRSACSSPATRRPSSWASGSWTWRRAPCCAPTSWPGTAPASPGRSSSTGR